MEGVLSVPETAKRSYPCAVLCPPHPYLHGGMDARILKVLCSALDQVGFLTLRFNYRGIGNSDGEFTNGKREFLDINSAIDTVTRWPKSDKKRVALIAYSFGASVALRSFRKLNSTKAIVLISPPLGAFVPSTDFSKGPATFILAGDRDRISPSEKIAEIISTVPGNFEFQVIGGAGHSFIGKEIQVSEYTIQFLSRVLYS